ncbi:MAG: endonuclease/exonuclease/phosphatase family protein [Pseudomonadota bacterium]|nr:endonuclease/exonuclease/phosphatase family protein [Pseudomonadota bacterium]
MSAVALRPLRIATYNIHDAVGSDRSFLPARIAAVLMELSADIVAIQEVGLHATGTDVLAHLRDATGYASVLGPTRIRHAGEYGNALLTRFVVQDTTLIDLTFKRREARGALDVVLDCDGAPLRVIATHLGLRPAERRTQIQQLLRVLEAQTAFPTVLMGDLNEWFLWGRPLRWMHAHFKKTPAMATFPARAPFLALDRIWVEPRSLLRRIWVHSSPLARSASDHLPLLAEIAEP